MKTTVSMGVVAVGVLLLMTACPWGPGETYTVVYDGNGATSGTVPASQTKTHSVALTLATNSGNLARTGYSFALWNTQADGSGTDYATGGSYTLDANLTLYAKWLGSNYTVTFDRQGGTGGSTSVTATFGSPMPFATAPTKPDFFFDGYYTDPNGTGTRYYTASMASARDWDIPADEQLVANWVDSERQSDHVGTLRYVPGGTYQRDGTPTNTTTVSGFYMSVHEITRARFLDIMGTDPSNEDISSGTGDPVQEVNWYHAIAFCNRVSVAEGRTPVYGVSGVDWVTLTYAGVPTGDDATWSAATMNMAANGYRLPTEAEWMWAAMGADQDAQPGAMQEGINRTGYAKPFAGYNGSNAIGDYAVFGYYGTEEGRTTVERTNSVGSRLPNELGLYDMSGNVLEWTWDRRENYPSGGLSDPTGPISGENRVARGASWGSDAYECAVAYRDYYYPYSRGGVLGFRVVSR